MRPAASNLFDLSGKVALVTGGSRGLGAVMARALAAAGAHTFSVARSAPEDGVKDVLVVQADLMVAEERARAVNEVVREAGRIDILVHAAGQQHRASAEDFPMDKWSDILELHLTAAMDLSQRAARDMLARGSGKIILVSSILAYQGGYTVPAYAAAKHAITGLVQALANEWAGRGINVNALAPGYFDAGVGEAVVNDPERGPQISARIPAGHPGQTEDLVGPIIFLASEASGYMHGQTLIIDGGWLAR
jgi:2-deoxy-D-gluconate 3-dehydrogenase